eukprot:XP_020395213.1 uncharacterized protein LOC103630629 isoform X2 [Zea mays]
MKMLQSTRMFLCRKIHQKVQKSSVNSYEVAKKRMYAFSTTTYIGFQAVMTEEMSEKFRATWMATRTTDVGDPTFFFSTSQFLRTDDSSFLLQPSSVDTHCSKEKEERGAHPWKKERLRRGLLAYGHTGSCD